jgi:cell fate regulator YaaT (PSP1 superfamily)
MRKITGIRLEEHGKIYHFDSGHFVLKKNDKVIVNTEQGQAFGIVCVEPKAPGENTPDRALKKVQRIATKRDLERYEKKCESETKIFDYCEKKIKERSLSMSIVSVSRLFDGSKIIVYFTADGRVDFRELVKDLVQKFRTRVEMRQIGVRHQAKMVGGLGSCGRQLCCASFLNTFEPVSIRMAKKQNISLNPSKISGMCGRLMCCLTYEYGYYDQMRKNIPKIGKSFNTKKGEGKVLRHNLIKETITVILDNSEEIEVPFRDIIKDN